MAFDSLTLNSGSGGSTATVDSFIDTDLVVRVIPYGGVAYGSLGGPYTVVTLTSGLPVQPQTGSSWTVTGTGGTFPVTDSGGSLTVDAPVATPVFVRLSDGSAAISTLPVTVSSSALPSGAATATLQNVANASLAVLDDVVFYEDAAATSGDGGVPALTVRQDSLSGSTSTDGDYSHLLTTSTGRLWTSAVIDTALPAGTNAIGKLASNTGVTIGAVEIAATQTLGTVTTVTSLTQFNGNAINLGNGAASTGTLRVTVASDSTGVLGVTGTVAHDAVDAGNPLKIGGKVSTTTPTAVANADRVDAYFDEYGRLVVSDRDPETGQTIGTTGLRDRLMAQRYTVLADSLADGLAGFWTSTTSGGGTTTSSGGEGLVETSAGGSGSAQLSSTVIQYFPGQVGWYNSAARFNDTGTANNTRRLGVFTVSGTTPQDGFYYELSGTILNAVVCKGGVATAVASTSWTRVAVAPFTLDTSFHFFEIRYTGNTVWFYVDNVLRHTVSGTTTPTTTTLNFPITLQSINTSGASNRILAVRNVGVGRFGNPEQPVSETGLSAVNAIAVGGGTPHDSVDSGSPLKVGARASTSLSGLTPVANADRTNLHAGADGVLIVREHCNLEDIVQERTTNTDGASTAFASGLAAPGAGVRLYITSVDICNSSAAFCTVDLRDGVAGSVLWTLPVPATGGVVKSFNPPLRLTANTALAFDASAATTTLTLSALGFKSKV